MVPRGSWKMDRFDTPMILYRPVGLQELALIYDSDMKAFPARLPQQPIFYPVLQLEYARQVASDWNVKNGQLAGYVTQFKVEDEFVSQFDEHTIGGSQHQELWIPAEDMEEFNRHIVGHIKVVEAHFGEKFQGFIPEQFGLRGKNAVEQFTLLANSFLYKRMDFYLEIKRNHKAVFLNYPFWQTYEFKNPGLKAKIIQAIKDAWLSAFPKIPLPLPVPDREETPLVKRTREQTLFDPDQEDITPEEQTDTDAYTLMDSDAEDDTFVEETGRPAYPVTKTVREDTPPIEQSYSYSLIKPLKKDITPVEQTDAEEPALVEPEDPAPADQTDANAHPSTNPVPHEGVTAVRQANSRPVPNPVHEGIRPVARAASQVVQGIELGLSGKYREATEVLSRAVEEDPGNVAALTSLGVAFHRLGAEDRGLTCYEAALKIDAQYAEAHYFRANILYSQGHVREAIAGYTMAIGLNPALIDAHEEPAPQDRLTDYSPSPAGMRWIAGPAHRILDMDKSLESNPRQANLFKERASAYSRLWNYEQAIADYSSFLAQKPQDADALHARGVAYEQLGQLDRALEDYEQALRIKPQLSDVYIHRGVIYGNMGNLRQSILSLTEGIRLAPQNPDGYFNRGTAYFQQGDLENAIADFSTVIQLSPTDEAAYYWRGISYEEAGRRDEAIADYRQFLALSQNETARAEIEGRLLLWNEERMDTIGTARELLGQLVRRVRNRRRVSEHRQSADPAPVEEPARGFDLYDLLEALGERALHSIWYGSHLECSGARAEELQALTEQGEPIEGHDLLDIVSGIQQTIQGDFYAFDPGGTSHWIFLHAWEGSGFYLETNDPKSKEHLKARFPSVEDVDEAAPPYEGVFIRI